MNKLVKRLFLVCIVLLSLPILLIVYNPSMQLGGFGLVLGVIGLSLSPLILFSTLLYTVVKLWK